MLWLAWSCCTTTVVNLSIGIGLVLMQKFGLPLTAEQMCNFVVNEWKKIAGVLSPYLSRLLPIVAWRMLDHPYTFPKGLIWIESLHPRNKVFRVVKSVDFFKTWLAVSLTFTILYLHLSSIENLWNPIYGLSKHYYHWTKDI